MNLLETLKKFKEIKADSSYAEKSRRMILSSPQREFFGSRQIFVRILETAGSLALAGVLVFAIAGGFSGSRYLSPISFQGIDPTALHAEAQAIDMQITIANVNYQEASKAESTTMTATSVPARAIKVPGAASPFLAAATSTSASSTSGGIMSTSSPSTTISINEALKELEQ